MIATRSLGLGDAEVGELHRPVLGAQDVARLDVAVHDAIAVRVVQPAAGCSRSATASAGPSSLLVAQQLRPRAARDELHDDVVAPARRPGRSRRPARCSGARAGRRRAPRGGSAPRTGGRRRGARPELDRHVALEPAVECARTVDMPPTPEARTELVAVGHHRAAHQPSSPAPGDAARPAGGAGSSVVGSVPGCGSVVVVGLRRLGRRRVGLRPSVPRLGLCRLARGRHGLGLRLLLRAPPGAICSRFLIPSSRRAASRSLTTREG